MAQLKVNPAIVDRISYDLFDTPLNLEVFLSTIEEDPAHSYEDTMYLEIRVARDVSECGFIDSDTLDNLSCLLGTDLYNISTSAHVDSAGSPCLDFWITFIKWVSEDDAGVLPWEMPEPGSKVRPATHSNFDSNLF